GSAGTQAPTSSARVAANVKTFNWLADWRSMAPSLPMMPVQGPIPVRDRPARTQPSPRPSPVTLARSSPRRLEFGLGPLDHARVGEQIERRHGHALRGQDEGAVAERRNGRFSELTA